MEVRPGIAHAYCLSAAAGAVAVAGSVAVAFPVSVSFGFGVLLFCPSRVLGQSELPHPDPRARTGRGSPLPSSVHPLPGTQIPKNAALWRAAPLLAPALQALCI